jgi:DNA-binding response OmpR family regulator
MTTVLVAEDDPDIRGLVVLKLEQAGFDVWAFGDGASALTRARAEPPDIAVLDVATPGMSGVDVCRQLRTHEETLETAVILLTGPGRSGDVMRGLAAGADDYVLKPFSPRDLVDRVRALLSVAPVG